MAQVVELGETAGSNLVSGGGSNSVTFTLPGSPRYAVQSVVATIDNTAGGDTTATLTMRDTNGEVIAAKAQGDAIPAGDTGTATFALRLDDSAAGGIRFNRLNIGGWLSVDTTSQDPILGYGIFLRTAAGNEIHIESDTTGATPLNLVGGIVNIDGVRSGVNLTADNGSNIIFSVAQAGGQIEADGPVVIKLEPNTATLEVVDASNNPLFRVNQDGSLQGKTGKALTFNL